MEDKMLKRIKINMTKPTAFIVKKKNLPVSGFQERKALSGQGIR